MKKKQITLSHSRRPSSSPICISFSGIVNVNHIPKIIKTKNKSQTTNTTVTENNQTKSTFGDKSANVTPGTQAAVMEHKLEGSLNMVGTQHHL